MQEYDIDIMKRNISTLMDKHNISQTTLALEIGVAQSRISRILNGKDSFTIPQLVKIAKYFHVSVNDILGLEPEEIEYETTLTDIYKALFNLEKISDFSIKAFEKSIEDEFGFTQKIQVPVIYFGNKNIQKTLEQWKCLAETNLEDATKKKVLELWEDDIIHSKEYRPKKWGFRTEKEWAIHAALEYPLIDIDKFELAELFHKYNTEIRAAFYDSSEYPDVLYNSLHEQLAFYRIPEDTDEELPFN